MLTKHNHFKYLDLDGRNRNKTTKENEMNISDIYLQAEKIAKLPRKARRLHISRVCKKYPDLNVYDLQEIIGLYLSASGSL